MGSAPERAAVGCVWVYHSRLAVGKAKEVNE